MSSLDVKLRQQAEAFFKVTTVFKSIFYMLRNPDGWCYQYYGDHVRINIKSKSNPPCLLATSHNPRNGAHHDYRLFEPDGVGFCNRRTITRLVKHSYKLIHKASFLCGKMVRSKNVEGVVAAALPVMEVNTTPPNYYRSVEELQPLSARHLGNLYYIQASEMPKWVQLILCPWRYTLSHLPQWYDKPEHHKSIAVDLSRFTGLPSAYEQYPNSSHRYTLCRPETLGNFEELDEAEVIHLILGGMPNPSTRVRLSGAYLSAMIHYVIYPLSFSGGKSSSDPDYLVGTMPLMTLREGYPHLNIW